MVRAARSCLVCPKVMSWSVSIRTWIWFVVKKCETVKLWHPFLKILRPCRIGSQWVVVVSMGDSWLLRIFWRAPRLCGRRPRSQRSGAFFCPSWMQARDVISSIVAFFLGGGVRWRSKDPSCVDFCDSLCWPKQNSSPFHRTCFCQFVTIFSLCLVHVWYKKQISYFSPHWLRQAGKERSAEAHAGWKKKPLLATWYISLISIWWSNMLKESRGINSK